MLKALAYSITLGFLVFALVWLGFRAEAIWTERTPLWWWFAKWTPRALGCIAALVSIPFTREMR